MVDVINYMDPAKRNEDGFTMDDVCAAWMRLSGPVRPRAEPPLRGSTCAVGIGAAAPGLLQTVVYGG